MSSSTSTVVPSLAARIPDDPTDADALYEAFVGWAADRGLELYPAQQEALLELVTGSHVVLATPTGSGKSLVAMAAHFVALAQGRRTYYTAPLKALVSEKFFDLVAAFGSD
ncbi:MAG: DEAD/DEAH box helicase, partial [Actinotalea sp.]|nr:DEAD/DEAH box helicase [Actinotalea sp.]